MQAEILALRHQLAVLRRRNPMRVCPNWRDRLFWTWLSRVWNEWRSALVIVQPATVLAWHRQGFRLYWRWKSRAGRPPIPNELHQLIRTMSINNPVWGAPRIHGELLKLGIEVSEATIDKYMVRAPKPPSQNWRTFLRNHVKDFVSVDFFIVPTVNFSLLYVFLVLAHDRRRVLHFNVTERPTAHWATQQLRDAFPWQTAPRFLLRDRDAIYGNEFRESVRAMGIEEVLTAPRSPWQNAFVERLIGSIRRECLDHVLIFNEAHLRRVLRSYFDYYHRSRTHLSLDKDSPETRAVEPPESGKIVEIPQVGALHHRYERRAA